MKESDGTDVVGKLVVGGCAIMCLVAYCMQPLAERYGLFFAIGWTGLVLSVFSEKR